MNDIIYKLKCLYNDIVHKNQINCDGEWTDIIPTIKLTDEQLDNCFLIYLDAIDNCPESLNALYITLSDGAVTYNDINAILLHGRQRLISNRLDRHMLELTLI